MDFRARDYFQAAVERLEQAHENYRTGKSYALSMYCAGLAVECLLRAYRWREDTSFEGRHRLLKLLKDCGLLTVNEEHLRERGLEEADVGRLSEELSTAVSEVATLWNNNMRYASEARLKAFLVSINRHLGQKGDPRKANALSLLNSARMIVERGVFLWKFGRK